MVVIGRLVSAPCLLTLHSAYARPLSGVWLRDSLSFLSRFVIFFRQPNHCFVLRYINSLPLKRGTAAGVEEADEPANHDAERSERKGIE